MLKILCLFSVIGIAGIGCGGYTTPSGTNAAGNAAVGGTDACAYVSCTGNSVCLSGVCAQSCTSNRDCGVSGSNTLCTPLPASAGIGNYCTHWSSALTKDLYSADYTQALSCPGIVPASNLWRLPSVLELTALYSNYLDVIGFYPPQSSGYNFWAAQKPDYPSNYSTVDLGYPSGGASESSQASSFRAFVQCVYTVPAQ